MSYFSILILAFALSVDSMVVSFSYGLLLKKDKLMSAILLALFTGAFQGIMPSIGYFLTNEVKSVISLYANWIIFFIFVYLGIKFIAEAFVENKKHEIQIGLKSLFLVGLATSIDAFSAGISLSLCGNNILKPALLIAVITFIDSLAGFFIGSRFKNIPSKGLLIFAGILFIILGIKAFI